MGSTFRRRWLAASLAVVAAFACLSPAWAAAPPKPRAAVILVGGAQADGVAKLAEVQLLASTAATFVERAELQAVADEQQLQLAFAAGATADRARLGKLLKADVLILVRQAAAPATPGVRRVKGGTVAKAGTPTTPAPAASGLEVVVCETARGLRLLTDVVPTSGKADQDAASLGKLAEAGISRQAQLGAGATIYAVPPFECADLGFEFEYQKRVYSRLLEQKLLGRPGSVVVELEEARSISTETAIAGEPVRRGLPLYLIGAYRNDGAADKRTVTIDLVVKRGAAEVAKGSRKGVPAADAASSLVRLADELLGKAGGVAPPATVPASAAAPGKSAAAEEATELYLRGERFIAIGAYAEATALFEAALLLDPNNPTYHRGAERSLLLLAGGGLGRTWHAVREPTEAQRQMFRAATEHFEGYIRGAEIRESRDGQAFDAFLRSAGDPTTPEEMRAFAMRVMRRKSEARVHDETPRCLEFTVEWREPKEPLEVGFQRKLDIIRECPDAFAPDGAILIRFLTGSNGTYSRDTPALRSAAAALKQMPADVCKTTGDTILRRLSEGKHVWSEAKITAARRIQPDTRKADADAPRLRLDDVSFNVFWDDGRPFVNHIGPIQGWIPAGRADVVWDKTNLYLMREKGKLVAIASVTGTVCFDGKYVWAAGTVKPAEEQMLIVLDPATGKYGEVGPKHGLPPQPLKSFAAAPLGPGRVIAAGGFGRTWVATVRFDPAGDSSVKVFYECRELDENGFLATGGKFGSPEVAFDPVYGATLTEQPKVAGGKARQRVLIGRAVSHWFFQYHPLSIDVDTLKVSVVEDRMFIPGNSPGVPEPRVAENACFGGSIFWTDHNPDNPGHSLRRLDASGEKAVKLDPVVPSGHIAFGGELIHIMGGEAGDYHVARTLAGPFVQLQVPEMPKSYSKPYLYRSQFYGMLLVSTFGRKVQAVTVEGKLPE